MRRAVITALLSLAFFAIGTSAFAADTFQYQPIIANSPLSPSAGSGCSLGTYLNTIFTIAIAVAVALAVIEIIIGGFAYMTVEAVAGKKDALKRISSALFGLVLLLATTLILTIINPSIIKLTVAGLNCSGGGAPQSTALGSNGTGLANPVEGNPPGGLTGSTGGSEGAGSGESCFTIEGGTKICTDSGSCQNLLDTQYADTATSDCTQTGGGGSFGTERTYYTGDNGYLYSDSPESIYYTGNGDAQFAYFVAFDLFSGTGKFRSPIRVSRKTTPTPTGITPEMIKRLYNLPETGGAGAIAIVDPYNAPNIEGDLNTFSQAFGLPLCTTANSCLEIHSFATTTATDRGGWAEEIALDVEWAHAIAPSAKILLVSSADESVPSQIKGVDYAASRSDVVSVSMSWTARESREVTNWDSHFESPHGAKFFAAAGDSGHEVNYPAVSPTVIGVGGTVFDPNGGPEVAWGYASSTSPAGWAGSGGGISQFEPEPAYQTSYKIPNASGKRGMPDVSYVACGPTESGMGYAVVLSGQWFQDCGTSAGTPQWAAIAALGSGATNSNFYADAAKNYSAYFNDVTSGQNGSCGYLCTARTGYDYVTGLGSAKTVHF